MQLRIAIPAFDRAWLFRHCLRSINQLRERALAEVLIYLDAGHEAELEDIVAAELPDAACKVLTQRLGPCKMVQRILSDYVASPDATRLLVLDSDMIARTDMVSRILSWPERNDMLVSVYNSGLHPAVRPSAARFVHKHAMGATGTIWSRELARLVLEYVPGAAAPHGSYDLTYCAFLRERGIPLCCSNLSLVQHLGLRGTNNIAFGKIDYGLNYTPDGPAQVEAMAEVLDDLMSNQGYFLGHPERRRRLSG